MPAPPLSEATIRRVIHVTRQALLDLRHDMAEPAATTSPRPQARSTRGPGEGPTTAPLASHTAQPRRR